MQLVARTFLVGLPSFFDMALTQNGEIEVKAPPVQDKTASTCLNCGKDVETAFCPHCGQENAGANLKLHGVLKEIFSEVVYYDSKIWRSVAALIFHPGKLSVQWSLGKRTRYISPVRLYLAITFLFFVVASWRGGTGVINIQSNSSKRAQSELIDDIADPATAPREREMLIKMMKSTKLSPDVQKSLDYAIVKGTTAQVDLAKSIPKGKSNWFTKQQDKIESAVTSDASGFQKRYIDQVPKVLFVILPLLAVALKCLYIRQKRFYVEHLVFLLHVHSFAFLALLVPEVFPPAWNAVQVVKDIILIGLPIYGYVAMLRFYRQKWLATAVKAFVLTSVYLVLFAVGALLALLLLLLQMDEVAPISHSNKPSIQTPGGPNNSGVTFQPGIPKGS